MKNLGFAYQPGQGEPIADPAGRVTRVWSNYFAKLALVQASDELRDLYVALAERVGKLEDGQALTIIGRNSVRTVGTGQVEIQLVGDENAPGNTEYYGTNASGEKGFHPVSDAIEVEVTELTKAVGLDGIITLGLADVPDAGGGTLQKTQFDAKGRKTGTSAATTDDLPEGSANLYHTAARAAAAAPVQSVNGETGAVVLVPGDLGLSAGNAGQFWRGDGVFSNSLNGPISVVSLNDAVNASGLTVAGYSSGTATVGVASNGRLQLTNSQATDTLIDIDPQPGDAVSTSQFRFFRNVGTTGSARFIVYLGNGTASTNAVIAGKGADSYVCANNGNFGVGTSAPTLAKLQVNGDYAPHADNTFSSGISSRRHSVVYAGTGAINTSDAREKTPVRPLTPAETAAAAALGGEIGVYQWLAMIATKGDGARRHIGMTVQRAIEIMQSHGLDPFAYGFICYDQWDELPEIRSEDGELVQDARPAGDRYSFRMGELLAFIARGLAHRLDGVEQRLRDAGL